ncbi:MAG: sensor histidine kinase N-terminal domain-containing protein [Burkholderiaceae bacterium]|nr:sensor histidine kinase N-terminal domain-containing protein [Burkholderiaceae bacterium]
MSARPRRFRLDLEGWHQASVGRTLALVLGLGMLVVLAAGLALSWRTASDAADAAYDRSLLGAIKSIDANVSTASGGLGVELPYTMLEFFQLTAGGAPVYYRVATEDGLVVIGDADLPPPQWPLQTGQPQFGNSAYFGVPVRLASWARPLGRAITGAGPDQRLVIQVAESLATRERFIRALVLQALLRDLALAAVALGLMALAVRWALRPLQRLGREVAARAPLDLTPISTRGLPADLRPLVAAINGHIARNQALSAAQRRFVDDASHQLRTPLTTLATQVAYALRLDDAAQQREVLEALRRQLDDTIRQTNQMLALARSDAAEFRPTAVDLTTLAGDLCRRWWREAQARGIDLGLEAPEVALPVQADAGLLREALDNLLHNALRFSPPGSAVTLQLQPAGRPDGLLRLAVIDAGPGIPSDELARAGERFFRARNAQQGSGSSSGLGLAIARAIAERHGGSLELTPRADGPGLVAALRLPAEPARNRPEAPG